MVGVGACTAFRNAGFSSRGEGTGITFRSYRSIFIWRRSLSRSKQVTSVSKRYAAEPTLSNPQTQTINRRPHNTTMIAEVIPIPAAAKVVEVGKNEKHREILFSLFGTGFARGRMFDRRAGHLQSKRPSSTRRGHPPPPMRCWLLPGLVSWTERQGGRAVNLLISYVRELCLIRQRLKTLVCRYLGRCFRLC